MVRSISDLLEIRGLKDEQIRSIISGKRTFTGEFIQRDKPADVESRALDSEEPAPSSDNELTLYGYSAVFDSDSEILYGFLRERIQRGAFKEVLRNKPDVVLLENHEGRPHARTINGTLKLEERPRGLFREAQLNPSRQDSRDLYEAVKRGEYTQSSFAFICGDDEWRMCECIDSPDYSGCDCVWDRTVTRVAELLDDSIVVAPAYKATTATVVTSDTESGDGVTSGSDSLERSATATPEERVDTAKESVPEIPASDMAESIRIWASI